MLVASADGYKNLCRLVTRMKMRAVKGEGALALEELEGYTSGLVALAESDVHLPVNIGNPDEFTLLEAAKTVIEVTESRSEIVFEALPVDDPQQRQPDISRAKDLLDWEPTVSLREALRLTVERAGVERLVGSPE